MPMAHDLLTSEPMGSGDIAALEARARRDIEMTAHPRMDWMEPRSYQGKPALDVLIVGAGRVGSAVAKSALASGHAGRPA